MLLSIWCKNDDNDDDDDDLITIHPFNKTLKPAACS